MALGYPLYVNAQEITNPFNSRLADGRVLYHGELSPEQIARWRAELQSDVSRQLALAYQRALPKSVKSPVSAAAAARPASSAFPKYSSVTVVSNRGGTTAIPVRGLGHVRPGFGATETDDVKERSLMPEEETALLAAGGALQTGAGKHYLVWRRDGRSPTDVAAEDSRKLTYLAIGAAVVAGVAGYLVGRRR